jgi:hypothetical protein
MGEGDLAAAEFQKLFDHPGIVGTEVIGALSHLRLARAQAMAVAKSQRVTPMRTFLLSGKTPTPISPSTGKPKWSMPACAKLEGLRKQKSQSGWILKQDSSVL